MEREETHTLNISRINRDLIRAIVAFGVFALFIYLVRLGNQGKFNIDNLSPGAERKTENPEIEN